VGAVRADLSTIGKRLGQFEHVTGKRIETLQIIGNILGSGRSIESALDHYCQVHPIFQKFLGAKHIPLTESRVNYLAETMGKLGIISGATVPFHVVTPPTCSC
jgi:hypothetical protein